MKKTVKYLLLSLLAAAALNATAPGEASANMKIFPLSPFFVDGVRTQHINIANNSQSPATFRIELIERKQAPDGASIPTSTPISSIDMRKVLIYSPRQVFLQAGDVQTIKLAMRRPPDLAEGEYRIYMKLSRMDVGNASDPLSTMNKKDSASFGKVGVQVSYALPIVLRRGKSDATAKLGEFKIIPKSGKKLTTLDFTIEHLGKFSTMGKTEIFWTPQGGAEKKVGGMANLNIFPEVDTRIVSVPIDDHVAGGTMRVVYKGDEDGPDKGTVFDEKSFPTPR